MTLSRPQPWISAPMAILATTVSVLTATFLLISCQATPAAEITFEGAEMVTTVTARRVPHGS